MVNILMVNYGFKVEDSILKNALFSMVFAKLQGQCITKSKKFLFLKKY